MREPMVRRRADGLVWVVAGASAVLALLTLVASRFVPAPPRGTFPRIRSAPATPGELLRSMGVGSLIWYGCFAAAPLFVWLSRRIPIERRNWKLSVPLHLATVIGLALGTAWVQYYLTYRGAPLAPPLAEYLKIGLLTDALPYLTVAVAAYAIDGRSRAYENDLEAARVRSQLAESRLEALTAQLQPHFLFNTLQGISTLIRHDPVAADAMLSDLGDLLREVLRRGERREVRLDEELRVLESYLAISRRRFGDRLTVKVETDRGVEGALVPFFVLQPLVENALHHGAGSRAGAATVSVRAHRENGSLILAVEDDGPGESASDAGRGIGLANTRERLVSLYGNSQRLAVGRTPEGGFRVLVELPYHELSAPGPTP